MTSDRPSDPVDRTGPPPAADPSPRRLPHEGVVPLLARAVELGVESVGRGGGPFGAVVARERDGVLEVVAEGWNQVTASNDPTAHAEVVALRAAGAALGTFDLSGCVMLASCEPCPMCLTAGLWARVDAMWFAASREDAAAAGFDDLAFYDAMAQPREEWAVPVAAVAVPGPTAPFLEWARAAARVEY